METPVSSYQYGGIDMYCDRNLSDLEYTDNVVLLSEDSSMLQVFLDHLDDSVCIFGMLSSSFRC